VSGLLLNSIDNVKVLLASYAPDLPLDDAYDSEIMDAFAEVLSLAFPFGSLDLELAYVRRQRWLAKLQAAEIVNALGRSLSGDSAKTSTKPAKRYTETSLDGLMSAMGTRWQ
jgi:hypothetical protein